MDFRRMFGLVVACLFWQCGSESPSSTSTTPVACQTDADCGKGGLCIERVCANTCKGASDCDEFHDCGIAPDGGQRCVPHCEDFLPTPGEDKSDLYACVNGVSTSCLTLDDTNCKVCGCSSNMLCTPGVGCGSQHAVGEPCTADSDCKTNNCSEAAGICRVPVGQPCDETNCDQCETNGSFQYCSRACLGDSECNGGACLGANGHYTCNPPCDSSCPGMCESYTKSLGGVGEYCACACTTSHQPQAIGTACEYGTDCASKLCYAASAPCPDSAFACTSNGFCSNTCTKSTDCPDGYRCAGADGYCLPVCDQTCRIGSCLSLATSEGDTAQLCEVKHESGYCRLDSDCLSNKCNTTAQQCAPSSPAANGSSCNAASDCASASCTRSYCYGHAVLGDPCTVSYDCAVGTCCTQGAEKGTCGMDCL